MKTFYDKLKAKFSTPPEEAPDWEMWDKISSQIGTSTRRRIIPFWWWIPIAILGSFGIGFISNGSETSSMNGKESFSMESINTSTRDTIYIEKEIVRVDTVFETRMVTRWKEKNERSESISELTSLNNEQSKALDNLSLINEELKKKQIILTNKFDHYKNAIQKSSFASSPEYIAIFSKKAKQADQAELAGQVDQGGQGEQGEQVDESDEDLVLTHTYMPITIRGLKKDFIFKNSQLRPFVLTKTSPSLAELLTPDYYNVGLSGDMPSFTSSPNFNQSSIKGGGVNINLVFSSRIQFETGIWYKNVKQNTDKLEIAALYPQPAVIDNDAEFEDLSLQTSILDFPALVKYNTWSNKKFRTYGKAGIIVSKINHQHFIYEYKKGEEEISYEVEGVQSKFNFNRIYIGYGLETKSWRSFSVFAEPYYIFNFNSNSDLNYKFNQFGLRFGAFYEL